MEKFLTTTCQNNQYEISEKLRKIINATNAKPSGQGWQGHCPTHDDQNPSLSINVEKNKILIHCFAGCEDKPYHYFFPKNERAESFKPISIKEYFYSNSKAQPALKVVRSDLENGDKRFTQYHYKNNSYLIGGTKEELQPFNYDVWKDEEEVYVVEGEKCAEALNAHGLNATTTPGGSNNWKSYFAKYFKNKKVICIPDNDTPGEKYIQSATNDICHFAKETKVIRLPELNHGEDVVDWLNKGRAISELRQVVTSTSCVDISEFAPEPLYRRIAEPEEFPSECLGEIAQNATMCLNESINSPVAISAQSLLAAISLAAQAHRNIEIDGRTYPLSLFFLTIAESGERKSANDREALKAHREIQEQAYRKYSQENDLYNTQIAIYESKFKKISNSKKTDLTEEIEKLGPKPLAPLLPELITSEPTYEGLIKCFQFGQPSMGLFSDEGGQLIGGHSFNKDNSLKTVAGLSNLWDGKEISRTRASEGSVTLYGRRLALHLMIQPSVAERLFSDPEVKGQGFLNRCLISYPKSNIGNRPYKEINISTSSAIIDFKSQIEKILALQKPLKLDKQNELDPANLSLSLESKKYWVEFHNEVEVQLKKNELYGTVQGFGSKIAEQALRIAGCLQFFSDPNSMVIEKNIMINSIKISRFYLNEFKRITDASAIPEDLKLARLTLDWIYNKSLDEITSTLIYQRGPNAVRTSEKAQKIISILENHRYLIPLSPEKKKKAWKVIYEKR